MHTWALLAKTDAADEDVMARVSLFANVHAGLPCAKCRRHYQETFSRMPYTSEHARNNALGLQWITDLRDVIQRGIDTEEKESAVHNVVAEPVKFSSKYLSCVPDSPGHLFTKPVCSLHTSSANAQRQLAIQRALKATEEHERTKADCGCNMRDSKFKRSSKFCEM